MIYKVEYWYRYGSEKDFDQVDIEADNEADAILNVKKLRRCIFKHTII
jgi:hypothetical protein